MAVRSHFSSDCGKDGEKSYNPEWKKLLVCLSTNIFSCNYLTFFISLVSKLKIRKAANPTSVSFLSHYASLQVHSWFLIAKKQPSQPIGWKSNLNKENKSNTKQKKFYGDFFHPDRLSKENFEYIYGVLNWIVWDTLL